MSAKVTFALLLLIALALCETRGAEHETAVLTNNVQEFIPRRSSEMEFPRDPMPYEEIRGAHPLADENGSEGKIPMEPTKRKESLLGRASTFAISYSYTPFNSYLVQRIGPPQMQISAIRLPGKAEQVIGDNLHLACVLAPPDQTQHGGDILFFPRIRNLIAKDGSPARLHGHTIAPWRILFSPAGDRLVSCSDDGTTRLWDLNEISLQQKQNGKTRVQNPNYCRQIARFTGYPIEENGKAVRGEFVAFSPGYSWFATVYGPKVTLRSPQDGSEQFSFEPQLPNTEQLPRVMALRFSPHGGKLLVFFENRNETKDDQFKFILYDIDTRKQQLFSGKHAVVDGRCTMYDEYVITWDGSSELVYWDPQTHQEVATLKVAPKHLYDVAFSPLGDVMATAGDDGEIKFWDVAKRVQLPTQLPYKHENVDLVQVRFEGQRMVTGSDDGWLKVWQAPEFFWDRRDPIAGMGNPTLDGKSQQRFTDGTVIESDRERHYKEYLPDGTVQEYKKQ